MTEPIKVTDPETGITYERGEERLGVLSHQEGLRFFDGVILKRIYKSRVQANCDGGWLSSSMWLADIYEAIPVEQPKSAPEPKPEVKWVPVYWGNYAVWQEGQSGPAYYDVAKNTAIMQTIPVILAAPKVKIEWASGAVVYSRASQNRGRAVTYKEHKTGLDIQRLIEEFESLIRIALSQGVPVFVWEEQNA